LAKRSWTGGQTGWTASMWISQDFDWEILGVRGGLSNGYIGSHLGF